MTYLLFATTIFSMLSALTIIIVAWRAQRELLEKMARVDPLTGIPDRRCFEETLDREWRHAQRRAAPGLAVDQQAAAQLADPLVEPEQAQAGARRGEIRAGAIVLDAQLERGLAADEHHRRLVGQPLEAGAVGEQPNECGVGVGRSIGPA